MSKFWLLTI